MRTIRVFVEHELIEKEIYELDTANSHHLLQVLKCKEGQQIVLFNGNEFDYLATIKKAYKKMQVSIENKQINLANPKLNIHLGQAIAKGQNMDYAIQKAVELGVSQLTPLITKRTIVKINKQQIEKKVQHWEKVAISACCQSGRSILPIINSPLKLGDWLQQDQSQIKLFPHPQEKQQLSTLNLQGTQNISITVGPEGGFSEEELCLAEKNDFKKINLGPRVLRSETAGLAVIAGLQVLIGDV